MRILHFTLKKINKSQSHSCVSAKKWESALRGLMVGKCMFLGLKSYRPDVVPLHSPCGDCPCMCWLWLHHDMPASSIRAVLLCTCPGHCFSAGFALVTANASLKCANPVSSFCLWRNQRMFQMYLPLGQVKFAEELKCSGECFLERQRDFYYTIYNYSFLLLCSLKSLCRKRCWAQKSLCLNL